MCALRNENDFYRRHFLVQLSRAASDKIRITTKVAIVTYENNVENKSNSESLTAKIKMPLKTISR